MVTLFLLTLGDFDYAELMNITPVWTPIYFFSFIIIVFFVMLNMFIGIVADSYATENSKPKVTLGYEVAMFLQSMKDGVVQPIMETYEMVTAIAEAMAKEEEAFRARIEAAKKRKEIGISIAEALCENNLEGLGTTLEAIWEIPIDPMEDFSLDEKLAEYKSGANQVKAMIPEIEEIGFQDGKQRFEVPPTHPLTHPFLLHASST
jgi:hypothetical protein